MSAKDRDPIESGRREGNRGDGSREDGKRFIRVGLMGEHPGWEQILNQIGAPWAQADTEELWATAANNSTSSSSSKTSSKTSVQNPPLPPLPPFSLLIIPVLLDASEMNIVLQWIRQDLAIIDCTGQFQDQMPVRSFIRSIKPNQITAPFSLPMSVDVFDHCLTLQNGATGKGILRVQEHRPVAFFGWDPMELFQDSSMTWRRFRHSTGPTVAERVAKRPSYPFMMLVLQLLVEMHRKVRLPFVHLWWHPDIDRTPFTFRIDTDFGSEESLTALYEVFRSFSIPATWFVHCGVLSDLTFLRRFEKQEIAFHCEDHREFRSMEGFRKDMNSGVRRLNAVLEEQHGPVRGYAAPYGGWSDALAEVLDGSGEALGFLYSSEFGYDYDGFPSVPPGIDTLQIPVHPVSFGTLKRFGYRGDQMTDYIREWVDVRAYLHLPLHLYTHPADMAPNQLREVLQMLSEVPLRAMTMREYAQRWGQRTAMAQRILCVVENGDLICDGMGVFDGMDAPKGTDVPEGMVRDDGSGGFDELEGLDGSKSSGWPLAVYPLPLGGLGQSTMDSSFEASAGLFGRRAQSAPPINPKTNTNTHIPSHRCFLTEWVEREPIHLSYPRDRGQHGNSGFSLPGSEPEARELLERRSQSNTLSWFRFRKYQYLSWLWRKKE